MPENLDHVRILVLAPVIAIEADHARKLPFEDEVTVLGVCPNKCKTWIFYIGRLLQCR